MATLTISETIVATGTPEGAQTLGPVSITLATPIEGVGTLTLSSSYAQLAVPTGASELHIYGPTTNAINLFIAGVSGDTGINIGPAQGDWVKIPVLSGTTTVWLKSASGSPVITWRFN